MGKNIIINRLMSITCIIYTVSILLGSVASVVFFPFMEALFAKLDIVECFSGSALAIMAFPTTKNMGFITYGNCIFFFVAGILLIFIMVPLLVAQFKKQPWGFYCTIGLQIVDMLFLLVHYYFLSDMLGMNNRGNYVVLSLMYKLFGIILLGGWTYCSKKKQ